MFQQILTFSYARFGFLDGLSGVFPYPLSFRKASFGFVYKTDCCSDRFLINLAFEVWVGRGHLSSCLARLLDSKMFYKRQSQKKKYARG